MDFMPLVIWIIFFPFSLVVESYLNKTKPSEKDRDTLGLIFWVGLIFFLGVGFFS